MSDKPDTEDMTQEEFDNVMRVLLGKAPVDEEAPICDEEENDN